MTTAGPSSLLVGQLAALAATPVALWTGACAPEACVAAGTRVATPFGWVSVEVLRPGDRILAACVATGALVEAPLRAVRRARRECVALVSATGERLVATPDHPIFAPTLGGFVDAGRMALGQVTRALIVEEGEPEARAREAELAPCETYAGVHEVFDLTVEGAFPTFVAEGFVVHNKSTPIPSPSGSSSRSSAG